MICISVVGQKWFCFVHIDAEGSHNVEHGVLFPVVSCLSVTYLFNLEKRFTRYIARLPGPISYLSYLLPPDVTLISEGQNLVMGQNHYLMVNSFINNQLISLSLTTT